MNGEIYLNIDLFDDELFIIQKEFITSDSYRIVININHKTDAQIILKDSEEFNNYVKSKYQELSDKTEWESSDHMLNSLIQEYLFESLDLIANCQTIYMNGDISTISEFLKRNNGLRGYCKKIILDETFELSKEKVRRLKELFGSYSNVYYKVNGNEEEITLEQYEKTVSSIDEIVKKIQRYNYSPLEQVIYAYDIVRDRIFKCETKNESHTKSSDLTQILFGENIVCTGFSKLFEAILNKLGIKCMQYSMKAIEKNKYGHRRNIALIEDEKYHINGIYFFDPTWDCRKLPDDNEFLNSYYFFAKTKKEIDEFHQGVYTDRTFAGFSEEFIFHLSDFLQENEPTTLAKSTVRTVNEVADFIDGTWLIHPLITSDDEFAKEIAMKDYNRELIIERLWEYFDLFDKKISANILLEAIYTVRKNEYYEDETKYPFDLASFKQIIKSSKWAFKSEKERIFLNAIFGENKSDLNTLRTMKKILKKIELEKKINQVKLAKTLRKVYEQKNN